MYSTGWIGIDLGLLEVQLSGLERWVLVVLYLSEESEKADETAVARSGESAGQAGD